MGSTTNDFTSIFGAHMPTEEEALQLSEEFGFLVCYPLKEQLSEAFERDKINTVLRSREMTLKEQKDLLKQIHDCCSGLHEALNKLLKTTKTIGLLRDSLGTPIAKHILRMKKDSATMERATGMLLRQMKDTKGVRQKDESWRFVLDLANIWYAGTGKEPKTWHDGAKVKYLGDFYYFVKKCAENRVEHLFNGGDPGSSIIKVLKVWKNYK